MFNTWTVDNWLTLFGLLGGGAAFVAGIREYVIAQRWKRTEWIATAVRLFLDDVKVQRALQMIDWSSKQICLFPDHPDPTRRDAIVVDDFVARALLTHHKHGPFTNEEAAVRDIFDHLLDRLALFEQFVETELVSVEHLRAHLGYWLNNIGRVRDQSTKHARIGALHSYIQEYEFTDVEKLLNRFGYDLAALKESEISRLKLLEGDKLLSYPNQKVFPTLE